MKKLIAILLLTLFLFNLAGYRLFFDYLQQQNTISAEVNLDKDNYNPQDLVTLKVPLSMPYIANQKAFERVDGVINIDGKAHRYVKRKIENGQLVLLCLPDEHKTQLDNGKTSFENHVNDIPSSSTNKKGTENIKKNFSVNEFEEIANLSFQQNISSVNSFDINPSFAAITSGYIGFSDKPPDKIS